MHKIKKYQLGKSLDINYQLPSVNKLAPNLPSLTTTTLMPPSMPLFKGSLGNRQINDVKNLNFKIDERFNKPNTTSIIAKNLGDLFVNFLSGTLSDGLIGDDSELGRSVGNIMSGALGTAGSTIIDNISKGNVITEGLQKNVGSTVSGIAGGLAANYAGQGISSLMGNSNLGKFTGGATSSALGLILGGGIGNPYAFGMNVLGSGLSAMTGPSKEYGGRYGNVTQTLDGIYNTAAGLVGTINPLAGGIMVLNKGLSNIFGSTSGMTIQDSILGSAFMPAPVKWLNMAGASKTGTFKNQSWQNTEKADSFMQNAFGNLGDKFRQAAEEAGKTYGTFSHGAKNRALDNINFANYAWNKVLAMADQNELLNIRSLYMTSINNLRYALNIQGGWNPLAVGKQGMKILNNATNHNMGMRLLSAAALIDNKQMILSALTGTKLYGAKKFRAMSEEELKNRKPEIVVSQTTPKTSEELNAEWERTHPNGGNADPNSSRISDLTSEVFNQTTKPPFTGQEYLEAAEAQRLKKLDKFHEAEKIGEATLMADMAVSAAPLLLRGFRWAFNKAGLLVKVPIQRTNLFLTSPYTGKWTLFGNREYRFKPGYAAMNGAPVESRPILELVKVGDAVINDPSLAYRQGYKGAVEHFIKTGQLLMNTNGANTLHPEFSQGKLFYGVGNNHQYPDLFVTSEKLQYASPSGKLLGFDPPKPNKLILQLKPGWTSSTKAAEPGQLNFNNVKAYTWEDGYGYREVPLSKLNETLQITSENAASITPEQWTAAQDAAIARGDMAEAQRLRDLHFKVSAPGTQIKDIQYHGAKGNAKFNVFDPKLIGQTDQGWAGRGYYFTPSIDYAKMYGSEPRAFYINAQKVHDGTASTYFGREDSPAARAFKIIRKRHGNDGQQILDDLASSDAIRTSFPQTQPYNGIFEEVVTRNNNQMKLADAVTYDNNGVRIPLGERDNFKLNDIRYGWLPWFLGGSTAATLYNTNK